MAKIEMETSRDQSERSKVSDLAHYETGPDSITWHKIWDHELDKIASISNPVALTIASTAAGAFVGLLPSAAEAISVAKSTAGFGLANVAVLIAWAVCFTLSVTVGYSAFQGHKDTTKTLSGIRERAKKRLD